MYNFIKPFTASGHRLCFFKNQCKLNVMDPQPSKNLGYKKASAKGIDPNELFPPPPPPTTVGVLMRIYTSCGYM